MCIPFDGKCSFCFYCCLWIDIFIVLFLFLLFFIDINQCHHLNFRCLLLHICVPYIHTTYVLCVFIYKFSTIYLNICSRGESLRTTLCAKTVVGGNQGHDSCKSLLFWQSLFFVLVKFYGDNKMVTKSM